MGIRARVFLIVFFSLAVSIRIAYVIAERDITSTFEEQTIYQLEKQAQLLLVNIDDVSKYSDIKVADSLADKLGNASDSRVTLILNNGVVARDVSGLGPDHINDVDMNNIEQIEVVRGPSSLMYSNGSIGGIINVVDNTIAKQDFEKSSLLRLAD